eukprot:3001192-Alexandrium_andersonii.AAC.1
MPACYELPPETDAAVALATPLLTPELCNLKSCSARDPLQMRQPHQAHRNMARSASVRQQRRRARPTGALRAADTRRSGGA